MPDDDTTPFDAVVVGAGISGLAVARHLQAAGLEVRVLEARPRLGGRLHAAGTPGSRLDLGATWFWPGETRVATLVEEFGIPTHAQHLDGDAVFHDRPTPQRIEGNPLDVPSSRFSDSAMCLVEAVAGTLAPDTIRTGAIVERITRTAAGVRLDLNGGSVTAAHAVLALPPATAVRSIHLDPPLTDRLAGLAANTPVWMGSIAKIVAVYERPFWRDHGLAGAAISHLGSIREFHDMSGPGGSPAALFGFAPLAAGGRAPTPDEAVAQLTEMFGPDAAAPTELHVADWRAEPFTTARGAAHLQTYQTYGHPLFAEPVDGRLHWSSTETSSVAPGHIEGALAAAERAAGAIIDA